MNGWRDVTLSDISMAIDYGYTARSSSINIGPKFLRITDIATSNIIDWNSVPFCSISQEDNEKYKLYSGDIVIARTGASTGATYTIKDTDPKDLVFASYLIRYRINPEIADANLVGKFLRSKNWNEYVSGVVGGSAQPGANAKVLGAYSFLLPPLTEQRAIASVLSSLDNKIDLLHRQNATLEAMAEALFRQWFVVEAKEEWEEKSLSDIAVFLNGLPCQKFRPQNLIERLPVLKIRELSNGISPDSEWATSTVPQEYIVRFGDVIFSWSGSLMIKIWDGDNCVLNQHLFKVNSNNYPKWFYYYWCKQHLNEFISISESKATTMGHIKRGDLDAAIVKVPSKNEMRTMSTIIEPYLNKFIQNKAQINTLEELRDTLLPKLMSGEVRVDF